MARQSRIEFAGAWYHVMNRGAARQDIFHGDHQRNRFLELLARAHDKHLVEIHAYCLMGNHYHLMLRTPVPNLHKVMQLIDGAYTQFFNISMRRDGPLFRGRYHAVLVQAESHWMGLSKYIHRNPLAGGVVDKLSDYMWSSYRAYLGLAAPPEWLHMDSIKLSTSSPWSPVHYKYFVETTSLDDDRAGELYEKGSHGMILGDEEFAIVVLQQVMQGKSSIYQRKDTTGLTPRGRSRPDPD